MLENCPSSSNSKLISGPLSICMREPKLKTPPQENDLIIFNYLEWVQGLAHAGIPKPSRKGWSPSPFLLGIIVDSGLCDRIHSTNIISQSSPLA
ncbi:hypothetical protein TNIN_30231 [Trichonephila inaurata madagascariensis]|uniref:Uncharacterized protein n=1 Tax=Trichonephila inaurata madagascariensis TaxID=2747483 RepID=A0A8X6XB71_9ARAC|nr:hypothetical protein TNIN_30231 [Trichonephila inaurata madagascariensis]